jgi:hypothetical protein
MYDASQFGQLNRLTEDFGMCIPIHRNRLAGDVSPPGMSTKPDGGLSDRPHAQKLTLLSLGLLVNSP